MECPCLYSPDDLTGRLVTRPGPRARFASSLCCIKADVGNGPSDVLMLFGGSSPGSEFLNDVWLLDVGHDGGGEQLMTWVTPGELDPAPAMRWGHTAVVYADRAFIFGM